MKEFTHGAIARFTQIDYARAMACVVLREATGVMLAVGRLHILSHGDIAEFAVLVRSDLQGQGLHWLLMQTLVEYARTEGIRLITGEVLADNKPMLQLCGEMGFSISADPTDPWTRVVRMQLDRAGAPVA